jgi:hypothetical protein
MPGMETSTIGVAAAPPRMQEWQGLRPPAARRLDLVRCGRAGPGRGRARSHLNAGAAECPFDARDRAFHRAGLTGHPPIAQARAHSPTTPATLTTRRHTRACRPPESACGRYWPMANPRLEPGDHPHVVGATVGEAARRAAPTLRRYALEWVDHPSPAATSSIAPTLTRPGARGPAPDGALRLDRGPPDHGRERNSGPSMTSWPSRSISGTGSSISPRKPASGSKQRKVSR